MNETEGKEGVGTASRVCPPGREIGMEPSRSEQIISFVSVENYTIVYSFKGGSLLLK